MRQLTIGIVILSILGLVAPAAVAADGDSGVTGMTKCEMDFTLKSWSVGYKKAKGEGVITCTNGETAKVTLKMRGGGLTVGKGEIRDGRGIFSEVRNIEEIFGSYVSAEAHAGAVKSAGAQALTKGEVSLSLTGKGSGVELGIAFGKFTIKRKK